MIYVRILFSFSIVLYLMQYLFSAEAWKNLCNKIFSEIIDNQTVVMLTPELNMLMHCIFFFIYCFVVWNAQIPFKHVSDLQLLPCYPSLQFLCSHWSSLPFCWGLNTSCHNLQLVKAVYGQNGVYKKILLSFYKIQELEIYIPFEDCVSSQILTAILFTAHHSVKRVPCVWF